MAVAHINGTNLFYTEVGDGIPILVMHGGLGVDHTRFREWLDPLGDVLRLVYYDHRCNGRSARPPIQSLTFDQLIADANALRAAPHRTRRLLLPACTGGAHAARHSRLDDGDLRTQRALSVR